MIIIPFNCECWARYLASYTRRPHRVDFQIIKICKVNLSVVANLNRVMSHEWYSIMAQITSNLMVCPTACSGWQQRKHQGSPLLALCLGNPWCLVGFPSQRPVIWKPFQCHDLIMKRWIFPSDVVALEDSIDGSVSKHTKLEAPCCYYYWFLIKCTTNNEM